MSLLCLRLGRDESNERARLVSGLSEGDENGMRINYARLIGMRKQ